MSTSPILEMTQAERLRSIFIPNAAKRIAQMANNPDARFAYYTSADTAFKIFSGSEVWLRNAAVMNDSTEVEHGLRLVRKCYGEFDEDLTNALDLCSPGSGFKLKQQFTGWAPHFRDKTFILCVSDHARKDDPFGRLSMWRAYGRNAGVAIVFKANTAFPQEVGDAGAYLFPVTYGDAGDIERGMKSAIQSIRENAGWLGTLGPDAAWANAFHMLRIFAVTTKHKSFIEEQEWRVVASPEIEPSPILKQSIECIGGIPQLVQKLTLQDYQSLGLNFELNRILDRVIIGPCEDSFTVKVAIEQLLRSAGVLDPGSKVYMSNVPLRQ